MDGGTVMEKTFPVALNSFVLICSDGTSGHNPCKKNGSHSIIMAPDLLTVEVKGSDLCCSPVIHLKWALSLVKKGRTTHLTLSLCFSTSSDQC